MVQKNLPLEKKCEVNGIKHNRLSLFGFIFMGQTRRFFFEIFFLGGAIMNIMLISGKKKTLRFFLGRLTEDIFFGQWRKGTGEDKAIIFF